MSDDWLDEIEPRLNKSFIYKTFQEKCMDDSAGDHAKALVKDAVSYAYHRSKTIIRNMPEFTLHDGEHQFRVLHLMERLLTKKNINELYIPELLLLILTAFFHDIGMTPDEITIISWKKFWDSEPEFENAHEESEYAQFAKFCLARPERLREIDEAYLQGKNTLSETLKQYLISDYIRSLHGERCRQIIEKDWNNKIKYRDIDLTVDFAEICAGHADDAVKIRNLDKRLLCGPELYACLPLIAVLLRISDILDFDLKRTPSVLFSHLAVRHPVSLQEWANHRTIDAWDINEKNIQFSAKCSHPAIESSIHKFCDLIDRELSVCSNIMNEINQFNLNNDRPLTVVFPFQVDREKIQTKKDISGKPIYHYRETRFDLSKIQRKKGSDL